MSRVRTRQVSAAFILFALLIPITAPVPAFSLDPPLSGDSELRLTQTEPSVRTSLVDLGEHLVDRLNAFIAPSTEKPNAEKEDRELLRTLSKRVVRIETQLADNSTIRVGESIALSALPLDKTGRVVNGIGINWTSGNDDIVAVRDNEGRAKREGVTSLIARSGNISRIFKINVVAPAARSKQPPPAALTPEEGDELRSRFSPQNNLGSPYGQIEAQAPNPTAALGRDLVERAGSGNFTFDVALASLPGRGIDAGVNIYYNSRQWNYWDNLFAPQNSRYRYNIDDDWLAPGFKLMLGNVKYLDSQRAVLTSPDGTRHELHFVSSSSQGRIYESMDGTFIQLHITTATGYPGNTVAVKYPDGTSATYTSFSPTSWNTNFFPTRITDRNGNTIHIAYKQNDTAGRIWYIRDTLNRYINFYYDSANKLVAVTVPGFDGGGERQTIRFYYETMAFDTTTARFQNADHTIPATADVLKYVYFPGTNTGYKYEYSPAWGIIYKISDLRGMQVSEDVNSPGSLTRMGTVTSEGQAAATTEYNYPMVLGTPLTDVPRFTTRTDDWAGRTTPQPAVTRYQVENDTTINRIKSKITSPDGSITETWTKITPSNAWDEGLMTDTFIRTLTNPQTQAYRTWGHTKLIWGNQAFTFGRRNPRVLKLEQTNDAGQTRATTYEYDNYNNRTVVKEHDFAAPDALGAELRKTEFTYETGAGWLNNRLLSLLSLMKTTVNNVVVTKVRIEYDNNGGPAPGNLMSRADIDTQTHDPRFNWSAGSQYDPVTDYRGNITRVTAFSDATLSADPGAAVTTTKYDVAGNKVEIGASCCKQKAWEYSKINEYAYPVIAKMGDQDQLQLSFTFDRNTGLVKTSTDANNQTTIVTYDTSSLRTMRTDFPDGSWQTVEYNDRTYPYFVKETTSLDLSRSLSSWKFSDGSGNGFRTRRQTARGYLSSDAEFDNMGRPFKAYNAYTVTRLDDERPAGIKFAQITEKDGLGRMLRSKLPDDTTVSIEYSGGVVTLTDQAQGKRRQIADALGRLIRVDEPDANGNLGDLGSPAQPTYFEYDGNQNLTRIVQTGAGTTQERRFKYDSLSRMTHERQVEAIPTLNDNGEKSAPALWTGVHKYDSESHLVESVDARGVKTSFTYDGLNRVKTVAHTGETGYQTPQVTYTYDEIQAGFFNTGRLTKIQTAASATYGIPETSHVFRYDKVGQILKHIQTIGDQSYQLQYTYNLAGQLTSETYPSGRVVNISIDNAGSVQTVADAQKTYLTGVTFDSRGLPSQVDLGNGTSETFAQNDRSQLESQGLNRGTAVLQKYNYGFGQLDANGSVDVTKNKGQLAQIESFIGTAKQWTQKFQYDSLSRLSDASEYRGDNGALSYKQRFDYDRFGNLYRKSASNPTAGQQNPLPYVPIEDADVDKATNRYATGTVYDEAGNVIADNKFRSMSFTYDANGRMVKAAKPDQSEAWTVYDATGNRVAEKIGNIWRFMIYDASGRLVSEYGLPGEGSGGIKYVHQGPRGSIGSVTNSNGFVVARTDHQAFGEEIGWGVGSRSLEQGYAAEPVTRQGYALTERDSTGLAHTWFRKYESLGGRWTSPDPYKGAMVPEDPQSFNRYSYVTNDPVNSVDPTGLYTACAHAAITRFLGNLAGLDKQVVDTLAAYAGDTYDDSADGEDMRADSAENYKQCKLNGTGPNPEIHLANAAQLRSNIAAYPKYMAAKDYRNAAYMLHSVQDALGAHLNYIKNGCEGHARATMQYYAPTKLPLFPQPAGSAGGEDPDIIIGDKKFVNMANKVFQMMSGQRRNLTPAEIDKLIDAILAECGSSNFIVIRRPRSGGVRDGGGRSGGKKGGRRPASDDLRWLDVYHGDRRRRVRLP